MRLLTAIAALFFALPLHAQELQSCDGFLKLGRGINLADHSGKSYANGTVRFAVVEGGQGGPTNRMFLAVFSPSLETGARRQCHVVGRDLENGFGAIALNASVADYNSVSGLTVQIPARDFVPEEGFTNATMLSINVNSRTRAVMVTQELENG